MSSSPASLSAPPASGSFLGRWKAAYDRRRGGRTVIALWIATRLIMFAFMATSESYVVGDVTYYWRKIAGLPLAGLDNTLTEYPTPVVWTLWLPYAIGRSKTAYLVTFIIAMMALDAAFGWALWRRAGRRHELSLDFWIIFVALIGPLAYLRFDLLPAVLAGGALLALGRSAMVSGALTGLGAAIKLWPALLMPALLARRQDRWRLTASFLTASLGLALISLFTGGWVRLLSPLTWQSARGLQVESLWATPLIIGRAVRPDHWIVHISRYQAYEIFGQGVAFWLHVSTLATVAGVIVLVVLWWRALRHRSLTEFEVGLVMLATVAILIITNKTLSPQYLLWAGGPAAVLLLLEARQSSAANSIAKRLAAQLLGLALLTHLVYPGLYNGLLGWWGHPGIVLSTVITTVRNLALLVFTVEVIRLAWKSTGATTT